MVESILKKNRNKLIKYNIASSLVTLVFINIFGLREAFFLMFLYSVHSTVIYALFFYYEILYFKGLSLNLPLLVAYTMRLVIPSLSCSINMINGGKVFFLLEQNIVNDYVFPTAVWINIYYMIFYWCISRYSSNICIEDIIRPFFKRFSLNKFTIPLFIFGTVYEILISFIPAGIIPGIVGTLLGSLVKFAIFIQLFSAIFRPTSFNRILFLIFILVSVWQTTFFGFYKGAIMMNILYYIIYYFLNCKYNNKRLITPKFVILCASVFLIIDFIIYPFMTTKRIVAGWDVTEGGIATNPYSNIEILKDVLAGNALSEKGDNSTIDRFNALPPNAFFYKECCTKGIRTTEIVRNNIELLVPRFINPNKHNSEAGLMVYAYAMYGSFDFKDIATSNNYIGQFASAYLIGGWVMVLLLAFINGRFTIFYYNFLLRHHENILSVIFLMSLFIGALMGFEEIHDGGALNIGYNLAVMLLIYVTSKVAPWLFCRLKFENDF